MKFKVRDLKSESLDLPLVPCACASDATHINT